jgi:hypothetical protein
MMDTSNFMDIATTYPFRHEGKSCSAPRTVLLNSRHEMRRKLVRTNSLNLAGALGPLSLIGKILAKAAAPRIEYRRRIYSVTITHSPITLAKPIVY